MVLEEPKNTLPGSEQQPDTRCRCNDGPINKGCDELISVDPTTRRQLRALAFHYLYAIDRSDYQESLTEVAERFLEGFSLKPRDHHFALELAQGVINNHERYAGLIQPLLEHWRFDRLGCCTRIVLLMAFWEFEQPNAVASIVINEAVELAKVFAERDAYRFVNGILDQAKNAYPHAIENDSQTEKSQSKSSSSSDEEGAVALQPSSDD